MTNPKIDKYNKKILDNKEKDFFIVFYKKGCPYCKGAMELFRRNKKSFKGYVVKDTNKILKKLIELKDLTGFNEDHTTVPIIFRKGKFIGGFDNLKEYMKDCA